MTKFHINPETGEAGECSAQTGNCPFGSDEEHYTSKEAARAAFEAQNTALPVPPLKSLRFNGHTWKHIIFKPGRYGNDEFALQLESLNEDGWMEPLTTVTVNLEDYEMHPQPGTFFVKTWSGNEGIDQALVDAGVIELTGREVPVNSYGSIAREARFTPAYEQLLKQKD